MKKTLDVAQIIIKIKQALEQKEGTKKCSMIIGTLGLIEMTSVYFLTF